MKIVLSIFAALFISAGATIQMQLVRRDIPLMNLGIGKVVTRILAIG